MIDRRFWRYFLEVAALAVGIGLLITAYACTGANSSLLGISSSGLQLMLLAFFAFTTAIATVLYLRNRHIGLWGFFADLLWWL